MNTIKSHANDRMTPKMTVSLAKTVIGVFVTDISVSGISSPAALFLGLR